MFTRNFINKVLIKYKIALGGKSHGHSKDVYIVTEENPNGTYTVKNLYKGEYLNSEDLHGYKILRKSDSHYDDSFYLERHPVNTFILSDVGKQGTIFHKKYKKYHYDGVYTIPDIGTIRIIYTRFPKIHIKSANDYEKAVTFVKENFKIAETPIKKYGYQIFDESKHKM